MDIVADIINGFVAIGTITMAIYTRLTVKAAKNSIDDTNKALEAANRTARATEEHAERMKDGLMPHLDLSVRIASTVTADGTVENDQTFNLAIRNSGAGPAIVRAFTHRDDIKRIRAWGSIPVSNGPGKRFEDEQIIDLTIGSKDAFTLLLPYKPEMYNEQDESVSSLSIFYSDIYGRLYRSRLVYLFQKKDGKNQALALNREHMMIESIPDLSLAGTAQREEGGPVFTYVPMFQSLYLLENIKSKVGTVVDGDSFTRDRKVRVSGIQIGYDGFPIIDAQIDNLPVFRLESHRTSRRIVNVLDPEGSNPEDWNQYGMAPTGTNDGENVLHVYRRLCIACIDVPSEVIGPLFT